MKQKTRNKKVMLFAIPGVSRNAAVEAAAIAAIVMGGAVAGGTDDLKGNNHNLSIQHAAPIGVDRYQVAKVDTRANTAGTYQAKIYGAATYDGITYPLDMSCTVIPSAAVKLQIFGFCVNAPCWHVAVLPGTNQLVVSIDKNALRTIPYTVTIIVRPIELDPTGFQITHDGSAGRKTQRSF